MSHPTMDPNMVPGHNQGHSQLPPQQPQHFNDDQFHPQFHPQLHPQIHPQQPLTQPTGPSSAQSMQSIQPAQPIQSMQPIAHQFGAPQQHFSQQQLYAPGQAQQYVQQQVFYPQHPLQQQQQQQQQQHQQQPPQIRHPASTPVMPSGTPPTSQQHPLPLASPSVPPALSPYILANERKSRRTHKNSRDGCPNCKSKRIKCTEELPSCANCIKKNYRCGYLDFPQDKLDAIKKKNDVKSSAKESPSSTVAPATPASPASFVKPKLSPYLQPSIESNSTGDFTPVNGFSNSSTISTPPNVYANTGKYSSSSGLLSGPPSGQSSGSASEPPSCPSDSVNSEDGERGFSYRRDTNDLDSQPLCNSHATLKMGQTFEAQKYTSQKLSPSQQELIPPQHRQQSSQLSVPQQSRRSHHHHRHQHNKKSSSLNTNFARLQQPVMDNFQTDQPFTSIGDLRKYVYANSFIKVAQDLNWTSLLENNDFEVPQMPKFKPMLARNKNDQEGNYTNPVPQYPEFYSHGSQDSQLVPPDQQQRLQQFQSLSLNSNNYMPQGDNYLIQDVSSFQNTNTSEDVSLENAPEQSPKVEPAPDTFEDFGLFTTNNKENTYHGPLPNAINKPTNFTKLEITPELQNVFLRKYLDHYQTSIDGLINEEYEYTFQPVWDNQISNRFWTTVFNQSEVLNVYFSFFMDRSLNFLLKVCGVVVNGDSYNSNLSSSVASYSASNSSRSSNVSTPRSPGGAGGTVNSENHNSNSYGNNSVVSSDDTGTPSSITDSPFNTVTSRFNKRDLNALTKKSFVHYGTLIQDLRKSLSEYHIEYPTKISLFSSWSSFIHSHSTVDTVSLLYSGTALLFSKILNEAASLRDVTPTIQVSIEIFHTHSLSALVPDYHLSPVHELYEFFGQFKLLCQSIMDEDFCAEEEMTKVQIARQKSNASDTTNAKRRKLKASFFDQSSKVESEMFDALEEEVRTRQFLNDQLFHHDLLELERFFAKLINEYYPTIMRINDYYKEQRGVKDQGIHFVSFSLSFEILSHWFRIFPSEVISIGRKMNPFKKTFFLFFSALGRCLVHLYPPIRSLMLVDPCHMFCPKIDFDFGVYHFNEFENLSGHTNNPDVTYQFKMLSNVSKNLLRMVNFFDNRLLFYAYYLAPHSAIEQKYVECVEPDVSAFGGDVGLPAYTDILHIIPNKLKVQERLINNFAVESIDFDCYPQFDEFLQDVNLKPAYQDEYMRQEQAKAARDYHQLDFRVGALPTDYNPQWVLQRAFARQKAVWEQNKPDIERLRTRMHYFELGRKEIKTSLKNRNKQ